MENRDLAREFKNCVNAIRKAVDKHGTDFDNLAAELGGFNIDKSECMFDFNMGPFCLTLQYRPNVYRMSNLIEVYDEEGDCVQRITTPKSCTTFKIKQNPA